MSGRDDSRGGGAGHVIGPDDGVARLVRAAGARTMVPAEVVERVRAVVRADWRRSVRRRVLARRLAWAGLPLAAAALWIAVVATGVWKPDRRAPGAGDPIAVLERVEGTVTWPPAAAPAPGAELAAGTPLGTEGGGRVALRLRSGASVRVDAGSSLVLASGAEIRLDRGRIYIETGTAPGAGTLAIRTPLGTVRDIGTRFQVRAGDRAVQVSVREGTALLELHGAAHRARAGDRIAVHGDGTVSREALPSSGPEWDWILDITPPFVLEGRTLGEYLDWVARETGLQVGYSDATILRDRSTVVLHGSLTGLRPDESLGAVLPACGLRHAISGGSLMIERATAGP